MRYKSQQCYTLYNIVGLEVGQLEKLNPDNGIAAFSACIYYRAFTDLERVFPLVGLVPTCHLLDVFSIHI